MTAPASPPAERPRFAWTGFVAAVVLSILRWSVSGVGFESTASYWVAPGVLMLIGVLLMLSKQWRPFGGAFLSGVLTVIGLETAFLIFLWWLHT